MRKLVAPLVTLAAVFAATLLPLHGQSAPPDLPKGYLISATYAGGKVEAMSFDTFETKNVYSGTIQNAAGKSYNFASKLVTAVLCLDAPLHDQINVQLAGSNGTFLRAKIQFADIKGAASTTEQLLAQKKELETLMEKHELQSALSRVAGMLDAAIAQSRLAAPAGEEAAAASANSAASAASAAAAAANAGFSFTTVSGKKFANAQVGGVSEEGVGLITDSGVVRVPLKEIPDGAPTFPEDARNQIVALQTAAAEKAAAEKAAAEKAAAELAAAEEAAAQKAAEKAEKERLAAEKAAERKAAAAAKAAEREAKKANADAAKKPKEEKPAATGASEEAPKS